MPNLASKVLHLTLDRLATDWQTQYGHPVLVVETFVDVAQFNGTVYSASGWSELGQTVRTDLKLVRFYRFEIDVIFFAISKQTLFFRFLLAIRSAPIYRAETELWIRLFLR